MRTAQRTFGQLLRLLAGIWSGHAFPLPAAAAETPPAATGKQVEAGGISGAQREFETLKAARDPNRPATAVLPRLSVPELHATPPAALRPGAATKTPATDRPGKSSATWLLDAMRQEERRRERAGLGDLRDRPRSPERDGSAAAVPIFGDRADPGYPAGADDAGAPDRGASGGAADPAVDPDRPPVAGAVNPLSPYLAEWLAPADFAMLKTVLDASARPDAGDRRAFGAGSQLPSGMTGVGLPLPPATTFGAGQLRSIVPTSSGTAGSPPTNPYLEALPVPRFETPVTSGLSSPPPPNLLPPPGPVAPPSPALPIGSSTPAKAKRPDFVRPLEDEKPFRTLKRF